MEPAVSSVSSSEYSTTSRAASARSAHASRVRRHPFAGIAATVVAAILYALSRTNLLTQDSMTYAVTALRGSFADLLHPHHLAYDLLLAGVLRISGAEGGDAALAAMQFFNIAISAVGVGVMLRLLLTLGVPIGRAALFTAVFATSSGYWLYSSQIEVYNLATLASLVAMLTYVRRDRSVWMLIGGALSIVLAMLSHQTAIFFAAGILAQIVVAHRGRERVRLLAAYIAIPAVIVAALYVWAAWYVTGDAGPRGLWLFATSYAHTGQWGSLEAKNAVKAIFGFVSSLVNVEDLRAGGFSALALVKLALLGIVALAVGLQVIRARRASPSVVGLRTLLLVWLVTHAAFVFWWHPSNVEFWILTVPIVVLGLASLRPKNPGAGLLRRLDAALPAMLLAIQLAINTGAVVAGTTSESDRAQLARTVATDARAEDLIVVTTHPAHVPYLRFHTPSAVSFPFPVVEPGTDDAAGIAAVSERLLADSRAAHARGGRVILLGDPLVIPGGDTPRGAGEQRGVRAWLDALDWREERRGELSLRIADPPTRN